MVGAKAECVFAFAFEVNSCVNICLVLVFSSCCCDVYYPCPPYHSILLVYIVVNSCDCSVSCRSCGMVCMHAELTFWRSVQQDKARLTGCDWHSLLVSLLPIKSVASLHHYVLLVGLGSIHFFLELDGAACAACTAILLSYCERCSVSEVLLALLNMVLQLC